MLLGKLRKREDKFNNTGEEKLDSIYHTILQLFEITFLARAFQDFAPYRREYFVMNIVRYK